MSSYYGDKIMYSVAPNIKFNTHYLVKKSEPSMGERLAKSRFRRVSLGENENLNY